MDTTPIASYSFIEKYFRIHPENRIGPGVYFQRIIIIWLITKIPAFILLTYIVSSDIISQDILRNNVILIAALISHTIFYTSGYFLSIKRTIDVGGKVWIPKTLFLLAIIGIMSMLVFGSESELSSGAVKLVGIYLFFISFEKSKQNTIQAS